MALPTAVALIYRESEVWCFLATMAVCLMVGMLLVRRKPKNQIFYVAESFVAVSLSWVLLSVMGAAPFVLSGYIPNPIDALFETVSGFTTTGASILRVWSSCRTAYYSGGVLRTGLAVWAFWYSF